jgi:hypothetical protein
MKDPLWKLRRLLDPTVSIDRAYSELNNPRRFSTPQATIEALLHSVKERGIGALKEPANMERLSRCDEAAVKQIKARIAKLENSDKCPKSSTR